MATFSPGLKTQLDAQPIKTGWAAIFQSVLGNSLRLRCFHDGVEFLNLAVTGSMTVVAGNIVDFGVLRSPIVKLDADLSSGTSVLRLEGNGESAEFTLGLPGSGREYEISANPSSDPDVAVAFSLGSGIKAPIMLDSGTGPLSPRPSAGMVTKFRLCDWSSGSRVVVGVAPFSHREPNLVLQHAWQAREYGDVLQMRVPDGAGLVLGTGGDAYLFAGDYLLGHAGMNAEANVPLQQVEVRAVPYQRWNTFPFRGDFRIDYDTTVPPAHKIELLDDDDNIVDVIEMYSTRDANNTPGSGWPVNDPRLSQYWNGGKPVQSWWNCLMVHPWWSHRPKMHSLASHLVPSVDADSMEPHNVASFDADPEQWPVITSNFSASGLGSYRIAPKWSRAKDAGLDTNLLDPYFTQPARDNYITQAVGYGFEPASTCKHTWFMAPGGPRHDRYGWPTVAISLITQPNGVRIHGAVPWRELWHHWSMGYFNHAHHYHTNVYTGHGIPKARILAGETCYNDTYYNGGNENFRPDIGNSAIRLLAAANQQHDGYLFDKNGRSFANQWSRDVLHNQSMASLPAYITVSPRHVKAARHSFTAAVTAAFDLSQSFDKHGFLVRSQAWYNWIMANAWIVANEDADGFTADEIESMWGRHLEQCYDAVVPEYRAQNTVWGVGLKRYGIQMQFEQVEGGYKLYPGYGVDQDSKMYYFTQMFILARQSGALERMMERSPKCRAALETIMECLTTYAAAVFLDTNGRAELVPPYGSNLPGGLQWPILPGNTIADIPADFSAFAPPNGQMDFLHQQDGSYSDYLDGIATVHLRAQWMWSLRDFFPDYRFPRQDETIAAIDGWYAMAKQKFLAGTGNQWHFRFPPAGKFNPPAKLGAPD